MEGQHNIDDLRLILRVLHDKIETLEAQDRTLSSAKANNLSKRIEKAKLQEAAILEKLSKSGVKL